ncbi:hypothetical protein [Natronosalvus caseinilyticus]|uniref:hypothetical protein n=1 Tax=Natronosalvus caseinilyticus TaxID=2953747 RepID=UPI0028AF22E3|nr:hypothetical protein [Natronosalvus caseinilyticus]
MTDDAPGVSASDEEVYQRFVRGDIPRSRARKLIGDDWETVAQAVSIKNAQESNEENEFSPDELADLIE